jgi:hypothetical protein
LKARPRKGNQDDQRRAADAPMLDWTGASPVSKNILRVGTARPIKNCLSSAAIKETSKNQRNQVTGQPHSAILLQRAAKGETAYLIAKDLGSDRHTAAKYAGLRQLIMGEQSVELILYLICSFDSGS